MNGGYAQFFMNLSVHDTRKTPRLFAGQRHRRTQRRGPVRARRSLLRKEPKSFVHSVIAPYLLLLAVLPIVVYASAVMAGLWACGVGLVLVFGAFALQIASVCVKSMRNSATFQKRPMHCKKEA